jgi:TPP-dependent trihydroxycyclohexane-1,2-dione (THcHDO) dehydratase
LPLQKCFNKAMPMIRMEFDSEKVSEQEALTLSNAAQKVVADVTGIKDVFVYANSSQIKVKVAPIEIFVEMSAHKIADADKLIDEIKAALSAWKKESGFKHPINLTLIPMQWKVEIDI